MLLAQMCNLMSCNLGLVGFEDWTLVRLLRPPHLSTYRHLVCPQVERKHENVAAYGVYLAEDTASIVREVGNSLEGDRQAGKRLSVLADRPCGPPQMTKKSLALNLCVILLGLQEVVGTEFLPFA